MPERIPLRLGQIGDLSKDRSLFAERRDELLVNMWIVVHRKKDCLIAVIRLHNDNEQK